jgi:hypothetical protein
VVDYTSNYVFDLDLQDVIDYLTMNDEIQVGDNVFSLYPNSNVFYRGVIYKLLSNNEYYVELEDGDTCIVKRNEIFRI